MNRLAVLAMFVALYGCGILPPPEPPEPPDPPEPAASLALSLSSDESQIGESERVTAQVLDQEGQPMSGVSVVFSVAGTNFADGSATTDPDGNAFYEYAGEEPGPDMVVAFADLNGDGQWQEEEPQDEAEKNWVEGPEVPFGVGEGEDVISECGSAGEAMSRLEISSAGPRPEGWLIVGEEASLEAHLFSSSGPTGGRVLWRLYDHMGGRMQVNGCAAIYRSPDTLGTAYQTSASITIAPYIETPPSPQTVGGEGGPRNAGPTGNARILIYDPANGPASLCGNEYLAVSASGPYSYSQNQFWYAGPATGGQFAGPFINRGTFQPVAPGRYVVRVVWQIDGVQRDYPVEVPECSWGKVAHSR